MDDKLADNDDRARKLEHAKLELGEVLTNAVIDTLGYLYQHDPEGTAPIMARLRDGLRAKVQEAERG